MPGATRWTHHEGHMPRMEHEPHFTCEMTGFTSHIRHATVDGWGRLVSARIPGALDPGGPELDVDPDLGFDPPLQSQTRTDDNPRPWQNVFVGGEPVQMP